MTYRRGVLFVGCIGLLSCAESSAPAPAELLGTTSQSVIAVPSGYYPYCSRTNGTAWELVANTYDSYPCSVALSGAGTIRRAGLFKSNGVNRVVVRCLSGMLVLQQEYSGTSAIGQAEAWATGKASCYFTIAPQDLPIFQQPMSATSMANLEPTGRGVDLAIGTTYANDTTCVTTGVSVAGLDYKSHGPSNSPNSDQGVAPELTSLTGGFWWVGMG